MLNDKTCKIMRKGFPLIALFISTLISFSPNLFATDLIRLSADPQARGSGDITGFSDSPLSAISANPAILGRLDDRVDLALNAVYVDSQFTTKLGSTVDADKGPGIVPEFAIKRDIADSNWSWGAGLVVQSAMEADFYFIDPPGTGGVSYGPQTHRSSYSVIKGSGALSYAVNDKLTVGFSLGILQNRNQLEAPYIFQSHPVLAGLKVLVDLDVDDIAFNGNIGLEYQLSETVRFSLAYSAEADFNAEGDVSGNLGQLGLGIQETFSYQARVETGLPATLSAGLLWQATDRLTVGAQFDRVGWGSRFASLPITLTQGTNNDLNTFLDSTSIVDVAPLAWDDQDTVHLGIEYLMPAGRVLRLGVDGSHVPVPTSTMTPLTGAILERGFSAGTTFPVNGTAVDVYYRYSGGDNVSIIDSQLAGDEYDNTNMALKIHSFGVSVSF